MILLILAIGKFDYKSASHYYILNLVLSLDPNVQSYYMLTVLSVDNQVNKNKNIKLLYNNDVKNHFKKHKQNKKHEKISINSIV